jgi:hypothetical protein
VRAGGGKARQSMDQQGVGKTRKRRIRFMRRRMLRRRMLLVVMGW